MKSFIVAVLFAVVLATISAQETDESLKGSEALYLANPYGAYGAYGAYPYGAAAGAFPVAGPIAPAAAPITPAAAFGAAPPGAAAYPAAYYIRR